MKALDDFTERMNSEPFMTLFMPWESPPLRSNEANMNRFKKSRIIKQIRSDAAWIVKGERERMQVPVHVTMVWEVPDRRVRDAGACSPTLKAAIDGLVDGGLLQGDSHKWVTSETCRIQITPGQRGVSIEIEPDFSGIEVPA